MTILRVLPVRRGDACFIRGRRGDYLFDGGVDGCALPAMLSERKIRKLRVVACTSLCRERLGGILDLLEADFPVGEYWFPYELKALCEAASQFNGNWNGWIQAAHGHKDDPSTGNKGDATTPLTNHLDQGPGWLQSSSILFALAMTACEEICLESWVGTSTVSPDQLLSALLERLAGRAATRWSDASGPTTLLATMSKQYAKGGAQVGLARMCGQLLLEEAERLPGGVERGLKSVVTTLTLTGMVAAYLATTPATLRFLKTNGNEMEHLVSGHPVKCFNAHVSQTGCLSSEPTTPVSILNSVKNLSGHRQSLVYQYGNGQSSVLICSDSKFCFLGRGKKLHLDRPTVIVAPRQGGTPAEQAYVRIHSDNPEQDIWVRSHNSYARKISTYFKEIPEKICLANCRDYTLQEIMLRFNGSYWERLAGGTCVCG